MKGLRMKFQGYFFIFISFITLSALWLPAENTKAAGAVQATRSQGPEIREDGLTVLVHEFPKKDDRGIDFLNLIVKTGYAHDPPMQLGLTRLTTDIIYQSLRYSEALVSCLNYSDFTVYRFVVTHNDFYKFCQDLDAVISAEAILEYDLCNRLIRNYQIQQRLPGQTAAANLAGLLYGETHPYTACFQPNYSNLDINGVNQWFRKIFRPGNLLISSTHQLPEDFLRKPSGRDLKEAVKLNPIPPVNPGTANSGPAVKFVPTRDNLNHISIGLPAPRIGASGFFPMILISRFLNGELKRQIREESGFCYDIQVAYPYLERATAPLLEISFQTLPGDTEAAIAKIMAVFKKISREGIPEEQLTPIINREKSLSSSQSGDTEQTMNQAWDNLFGQKWFANSTEYMTQLTEASTHVKNTMTQSMGQIKISITGPPETETAVSRIIALIKK